MKKTLIVLFAVLATYLSSFAATVDVLNVWWETGNYSPEIVNRLHAEDEAQYDRWYTEYVNTPTNDVLRREWLYRQMQPDHSGITTNTVHWMKAHPASIEDPYIVVTAWQRYGWFNLFWRKDMSSPWIQVVSLSEQHMGIVDYRIHMHPKSEATIAMLNSNEGYFAQNIWDLSIVSSYDRRYGEDDYIYRLDLSNFLGESNRVSYANLTIKGYAIGTELASSYPIITPTAPSTEPPEVPPVQIEPVKKFWLNTNSNTRHNESCRYFENTSAGRYCTEDEGTECRVCGG